MADFSLLRLHPNDERELRWFFQQSEGALGLRSGHESLVNACLGGKNKGSKPVGAARQFQVAQRQLEAADRARRIAHRLSAIAPRDLRTLAAAYGGPLPRRIGAPWVKLAGFEIAPALLYLAARRRKFSLAQLEERGSAGKAALRLLIGQARVALAVASTAYEVVR